MRVLKRGNRGYENISFDKITSRLRYLCKGLDPVVDPTKVTLQTIQNLYDGISTEELDKISAKIAESLKLIHPDYAILAGRICISNLHKTTPNKFSECMSLIRKNSKKISIEHHDFIERFASELDNMIIHDNDYNFDYFGFKTLENAYLNKDLTGKICDRPQYMYMRVAVSIYKDFSDKSKEFLEQIKICYKALSQMYFIHATPTLFNACTHNQQLLSCFLLGTEDSIESIMSNLTDASLISKWAGGIGIHMHCIRSKGSKIHGTNGKSSGLCKQLKIYNEAARCWDQGGKRLGAFAIYLEPWHGDIVDFLKMKLNTGATTERAHDLFYAVWVPDLFVKRVSEDIDWSLFSEDTAPYLSDVYDGMSVCKTCGKIDTLDMSYVNDGAIVGNINAQNCDHIWEIRDVFTDLYTQYEKEGRQIETVRARDISDLICALRRESGVPYIGYKDHVNRKSNQKNIGTIKSSNLCTEIVEYSSFDSFASCCLASINVRKFLILNPSDPTKSKIDHEKLHDLVKLIARNLDIIIDINKYPVEKCRINSQNYRPIGIGIQGLSDLFCEMRIPFLSDIAMIHDIEIMETIYHGALEASMERAVTHGKYVGFEGSPASQGKLQFDLWIEDIRKRNVGLTCHFSGRYNWDDLKNKIKENGLRNSLCVAPMPTVTTSQILSNSESFEPGLLIYNKGTLSGEFMVSNWVMIRHLIELGIWNEDIANQIITNNGSLQKIEGIPDDLKKIYKTVWELSQMEIMKRAALRGSFVDQSQSLNIHVKDTSNEVLESIFLYGHELGLKTMYYLRSLPGTDPLKNNLSISNKKPESCKKGSTDCESCSS